MKYLKAAKKNAENVKKQILSLDLLDKSRKIGFEGNSVLFPLIDISNRRLKKYIEKSIKYKIELIDKKNLDSAQKNNANSITQIFEKYKDNLAKGYDILGNIAIIKSELNKNEELEVAKEILNFNKQITTVVAQMGAVSGKYRLRKFRYVSGIKTFISNYRESGCLFKFDIRKTFFSNRLSYERERINSQVKENENICVMFAGVGPFAIEIAKKHKSTHIVAIEMNKNAVKYMEDNIIINKTPNIKAVLGDVRIQSKNYKGFADRIIVPMPKSSIEFLDQILEVSKKKAIVHIYLFGDKESVFNETRRVLKTHAKNNNYTVKILLERVVRPYSKNEIEVVVDYRINRKLLA